MSYLLYKSGGENLNGSRGFCRYLEQKKKCCSALLVENKKNKINFVDGQYERKKVFDVKSQKKFAQGFFSLRKAKKIFRKSKGTM